MFKVNMLVIAVVFGFAGLFILALFAWSEAQKYVRALRAIQRIAAPGRRERLAISRMSSRMTSRNSNENSIRVA